jgi:hypothetical protein
MTRAIRWLRWSRADSSRREGLSYVHAFLVDPEGHVARSVCKKKPPPDAEVVEIAPGHPDRCFACDDALRFKGRHTLRVKKSVVSYKPRYTFAADWEEKP